MKQITERLDELRRGLKTLILASADFNDMAGHPGAVGLNVTAENGWEFTIASFPIEGHDSPGYDGAVVMGSTIVHLPKNLCEEVFKKAREHEAQRIRDS